MVVVVGIDPTSSAYEAGAHPSTPYNPNRFGVTTGNRTQTKRITISVANRYNIATPKQFTICKHTDMFHYTTAKYWAILRGRGFDPLDFNVFAYRYHI